MPAEARPPGRPPTRRARRAAGSRAPPMSEPPPPLNERQQRWLTSFLVLGSTAFGLVVLSYLAAYWVYFGDVILTFFLAWLLAFILSSPVRLLLRAVPRLPRVVAG